MKDDDWDLIKGPSAHRIEVLNYLSQVNQIAAMVVFSLYHHPAEESGSKQHPNKRALKELHRTGTFLLLAKPGEFRTDGVVLEFPNGEIAYEPPPHQEVEERLDGFFAELNTRWHKLQPVEAAAFTLWFINWVHPFKNGNGRSARAFCYASMAMKMGYVPPGERTVPELIKENDDEYQLALRKADRAYNATGTPDLSSLEALLDRLIAEQLEAALAEEEKRKAAEVAPSD
jgi:Fic family protein